MATGLLAMVVAAGLLSLSCLPAAAADERGAAASGAPRWHGEGRSFNYFPAPESEIKELPDNRVQVLAGEVLILPNQTVTVLTAMAQTQLPHGVAVSFNVRHGSERLMVLSGDLSKPVPVVCFGTHRIDLSPGSEALITDHDPSYREIAQSDDIGRRQVRLMELGHHRNVVTAEIQLMEALQLDPLLYELAHADDSRSRSLREHIIKTCAVLKMLTGVRGSYSHGSGF